jgi:hypothetical protein
MNNDRHFYMLHELVLKKRVCRQHNLPFSYFDKQKKSLFCSYCINSIKNRANDLFYFNNFSAIFSHYLNVYEYRECTIHKKLLTCFCMNHMTYYCDLCKKNCDFRHTNSFVEVQQNIMFQDIQKGIPVIKENKAHYEKEEQMKIVNRSTNVNKPSVNNISTTDSTFFSIESSLFQTNKPKAETNNLNNVKLDLSMSGCYFSFNNNTNLILYNFVNNSYKKYKVSKNNNFKLINYLNPNKKYEKIYILEDDSIYYFDIMKEKMELKTKLEGYVKLDDIAGITDDDVVIGVLESRLCTYNLKNNKYKCYNDINNPIYFESESSCTELVDGDKSLFIHLHSIEDNVLEILLYNNNYSTVLEANKYSYFDLKHDGKYRSRITISGAVLFSIGKKVYLRYKNYSEVDIYELCFDELNYKHVNNHSEKIFELDIDIRPRSYNVIEDKFYFLNYDYVLVKYDLDRNNYTEVYEFI